MRYAFRLIALTSTTICGILFLGYVYVLLTTYNYAHRRFPPAICDHVVVPAMLVGLGFFVSAFLYAFAARKSK